MSKRRYRKRMDKYILERACSGRLQTGRLLQESRCLAVGHGPSGPVRKRGRMERGLDRLGIRFRGEIGGRACDFGGPVRGATL